MEAVRHIPQFEILAGSKSKQDEPTEVGVDMGAPEGDKAIPLRTHYWKLETYGAEVTDEALELIIEQLRAGVYKGEF